MLARLGYYTFLMMVSPFLTLYLSLKERNIVVKKWVIILFFTIFGSVILFTPTADGTRHLMVVNDHYLGMSFTDFWQGIISIIDLRPTYYQRGDPYIHVLAYISGGVFQSPKLFYVMAAFIYGYFYTSSILFIFNKYKVKKFSMLIGLIGLTIVFWEGIEGVNSVRTWTGAWVLFYGVLNYFEKKQFKYLVLIALAPMIHFAYFMITIPVWLVIIFKVNPRVYTFLFVVSFFFTFNTARGIVEIIKSSSEIGENRVSAYDKGEDTYEELSEIQRSKKVWYANIGATGRFTAMTILIFILIIQGNYFSKMTDFERSLFSIVLLLVVLANFGSVIPALKYRTMRNAGIYLLAVTFMLLADKRFYLNGFPRIILDFALFLVIILFSIFLLYKFASLIYFLSVFLFISPSLVWFFNDMNFSIRDIFN